MTRRLLIVSLAVLMALPNIVFASGGANPGLQRDEKITGPTFNATVVVDAGKGLPAGSPRMATVRIKKGALVSGVVFPVNPEFLFSIYGCVLLSPVELKGYPAYSDLTEVRFLNQPLNTWIPTQKIADLYSAVGIKIDPNTGNFIGPNYVAVPMVTSVENAVCVLPLADTGTLSFDAVIQFMIPQN